jgi:hypothetical protein
VGGQHDPIAEVDRTNVLRTSTRTSAHVMLGWTAPNGIAMCQSEFVEAQSRGPSVEQIIRIGIDTSKSVFQLHGVNGAEQPILRKKLSRGEGPAFGTQVVDLY